MKGMTIKVIFLTIVGIVFVAGCEEENKIDTKKSRLIAAENMHLKKDLERCQKEKGKQKELLEQCEQAKKVIEEQSAKEVEDLFDGILGDVLEESQWLREENEKLRMEIGQLKMEITELKKELEMHKGPTPLPHTD